MIISVLVCDCCGTRREDEDDVDRFDSEWCRVRNWTRITDPRGPTRHYCPECKVPATLAKQEVVR